MKKVKSFFSMKKLVLGALACAALVLLMPGEAKAAVTFNGYNFVFDSNSNYNCGNWNGSTWMIQNVIINGESSENQVVKFSVPAATIVVKGDTTITAPEGKKAIVAEGDLTIDCGGGNLTVNGTIYCSGNLTIKGANNLTINCSSSNAIFMGNSSKKLTFNGTGITKITSDSVAITADKLDIQNGNIEIKGNGGWLLGLTGNKELTINSVLKVSWGSDANSLTESGVTYTSSYENSLLNYSTYYVKIYNPNPGSDPGTPDPSNPSETKSDDKKNESSPFHKFETNSIKEAKASGKIDATGGWKSFDRGTLNELAKLGKDISVTYDFNGHTYCVVVPKGFDPQKLVNEEGYCGFLYLAKVYGAVMIK